MTLPISIHPRTNYFLPIRVEKQQSPFLKKTRASILAECAPPPMGNEENILIFGEEIRSRGWLLLEYFYIISLLPVNWSLDFHISGRFGSISRLLRGVRFKIFSNHGRMTSKFRVLGEEIRYLTYAEGEWISSFHQNIYPWSEKFKGS